MTSSPSLHKSTGSHSQRLLSGHGGGTRARVEMHKVDVQLQKEISRLERQQSAAVTNIANHQQAMKMSWRKLEQRRAAESPLLSRSKGTTSNSPTPRRGLLHSNTKLYPTDSAPPMSTVVSPLVVTVTGDIHHKRQIGSRGPPPSANKNEHFSSSYLSSPYNLRRMNVGPKTSIKQLSTKDIHVERSPTDHKLQPSTHLEMRSDQITSSEPVLASGSNTSNKDTLLRASVLMGVESASSGPQSFKNFYSSGVERSQSAASFLISSNDQKEKSDISILGDPSEERDLASNTDNPEGDLAKMFEDIKNCRYIRRYHPDGTALDEYI